jgi:isopropylmalate/homocitrate/citramalate synthase
MSDLPKHVEIHEEGPREGFQIEPGPISTQDKIRLIDALSETGLHHIQACSFVNPRLVPGWADAEAVAAGFTAKPGVHYTGTVFQRQRPRPGAGVQGQAEHQRLDFVDGV